MSNDQPSRLTRRVWALTAVWVLCVAAPELAVAQAPAREAVYVGDVVVVQQDEPLSRSPGKSNPGASVVKKGAKMHVTDVQSDWIGGIVDVDGVARLTWLRRANARLETLPAEAAAPVAISRQPDDPAAVAALEKHAVKLEKNEQGNVHSADASEARLADGDLVHFQGLHQLVSLDLSGNRITDQGIAHLASLKTLQELYLNETGITDAGLALLRGLNQLEILALQKTRITGGSLVNLAAMPRLLVLNLGDCAIADADLEHLRPLSVLEVLSVTKTRVTSAGIHHLKSNAKLRVLNLIGCNVDDRGLEPMKSLGNLRIV
ncbi:MAG: leucine-rich repeat domain-containing protein, partial [Pirellulaceae bacterium]